MGGNRGAAKVCQNTGMKIRQLHPWDLSVAEARAVQERLAPRVVVEPLPRPPVLVAGIDVSCPPGGETGVAGAVVVHLPSLRVVDAVFARGPLLFPYVPGYLSFREGPLVLEALGQLSCDPDLLLFDAQGICHPRRLGLASHLGVILDRPAVGCAKSLLVGSHAEPGAQRGCRRRIVDRGETVGAALRTRDGVAPVYVSVGHRVDLAGAIRTVLACGGGYRIPEPLREAHRQVGVLARSLAGVEPGFPDAEAHAC